MDINEIFRDLPVELKNDNAALHCQSLGVSNRDIMYATARGIDLGFLSLALALGATFEELGQVAEFGDEADWACYVELRRILVTHEEALSLMQIQHSIDNLQGSSHILVAEAITSGLTREQILDRALHYDQEGLLEYLSQVTNLPW